MTGFGNRNPFGDDMGGPSCPGESGEPRYRFGGTEKGTVYLEDTEPDSCGEPFVIRCLSHQFTLGEAQAFALALGIGNKKTTKVYWRSGHSDPLAEVTYDEESGNIQTWERVIS